MGVAEAIQGAVDRSKWVSQSTSSGGSVLPVAATMEAAAATAMEQVVGMANYVAVLETFAATKVPAATTAAA